MIGSQSEPAVMVNSIRVVRVLVFALLLKIRLVGVKVSSTVVVSRLTPWNFLSLPLQTLVVLFQAQLRFSVVDFVGV